MRSPQYGKKRAERGASAPTPAYAFRGMGKPFVAPAVTVRAKPTMWGGRAVGLHGPNAALPGKRIKYRAPKTALYSDGTLGAPCTLRRDHKSATWVEGIRDDRNNPVVTKPYTVVSKGTADN